MNPPRRGHRRIFVFQQEITMTPPTASTPSRRINAALGGGFCFIAGSTWHELRGESAADWITIFLLASMCLAGIVTLWRATATKPAT